MVEGQPCEAFTKKGDHCQRKAVTYHDTPGDRVYLCKRHYRMIHLRQRQGSDEEVVRRWRTLP